MAISITRTTLDFQSPNSLAPYTETVTGGLPPYTASSSNVEVATVAQGTSNNLLPNPDTLSNAELSSMTTATGGPGGAVDAEFTGTGSPQSASINVDLPVAVTPGLSYTYSADVDISHQTGGILVFGFVGGTGWSFLTNIVPANGSPEQRFGCPYTPYTNLVPEGSGSTPSYAGWTFGGTATWGTMTGITSGSRVVCPYIQLQSGTDTATSPSISVKAGDVVSFWSVGNNNITTGSVLVTLIDQNGVAIPGFSAASTGRVAQQVNFTVPAGVTSVKIVVNANGATGLGTSPFFKLIGLSLAKSSSSLNDYISTLKPQLQAYAQWNNATVTSGQKVKYSQPMVALSTVDYTAYQSPTSSWIVTPKYRGSATITYTDSTP
jgi:hypothetical protein